MIPQKIRVFVYKLIGYKNTEYYSAPGKRTGNERYQGFFEALEIKFEFAQDSPYNPEFMDKIEKSRKQAAEGNTVKIDLDDMGQAKKNLLVYDIFIS